VIIDDQNPGHDFPFDGRAERMPTAMFKALVQSIVQTARLASALPCAGAWKIGLRTRPDLLMLALIAWLPAAPVLAAVPDIHFAAASIEAGSLRLEGVRGDLVGLHRFELSVERAAGPAEGLLQDGLQLEGVLESLSLEQESLVLSILLESRGLQARVSLSRDEEGLLLRTNASAQPLTAAAHWSDLPSQAGWLHSGTFDVDASFAWPREGPGACDWRLNIDGLGFDSPEGRFAGESLQLDLSGQWPDLDRSAMTVQVGLRSGELLIDDFYRDFSSAAIGSRAELSWADEELTVANLSLSDGDALSLEAGLRVDLDGESEQPALRALEINRLELDFPGAYQRYLEPMAAAWALNGLEVTGRLAWRGQWSSGELVSGDLLVSDLSAVDISRDRFAVTGLEAHLRPGDYGFDSRLSWRGLLFGRINLGAGEAMLDSEPGAIALLEPLTLQMLGGSVELETLKLILPGARGDGSGEPDVLMRAHIRELDMGEVTSALDWPAFTGSISGEIPGVSLDDGVLAVDGEIFFDVFGGRIALQHLSMERPFGVLPSLAADVIVTDLDLEQLTRTFSFGRIAGRLDGYVRDLRMLDWAPVAFDAWFGTPDRQEGSNDISRQAVNRLTTIGGGSATAALTGPLMRMFSSFSYRRLGLGCRLQNNVCALRGLSEDQASVLILEGAGVPKITIRAFNRSVDWPQMVSNLLAISTDNPVQVGTPTEP
jgi:hypothetical protein